MLEDREVENARRVILCSGRVAHDLLEARAERNIDDAAIIRLEQLYPFPEIEIAEALQRHPRAEKFIWIQEEPGNQGALCFLRPRLQRLLSDRHLWTVKRSDSASPSTGSARAHALEQQVLLDMAFT